MSSINNDIPFVPDMVVDPAAGTNAAINTIDALLQLRVLSVGTTAPPATPVVGGRYIVGAAPTGAWEGQAQKLARWLNGGWTFYDASIAVNATDNSLYIRGATVWVKVGP